MLPIADLHCDTALELEAGEDLASNPRGHVDLVRMREGGVGLQFFAAFLSPRVPAAHVWRRCCGLLDAVERNLARHGDAIEKVDSAAQVEDAWRRGRMAGILAVESGAAIEEDLGRLEILRRRGVRYMTLTHSGSLTWAGSSGDGGPGLTDFGRKVVACMEDLGILVDVSHVSDATFWDVARCARKPFIASHSNARSLCPAGRNLTDDMIRAVADSGGVVGVNLFPGFLEGPYLAALPTRTTEMFEEFSALEGEYPCDPVDRMARSRGVTDRFQARMADLKVPLERAADHLEHLLALGGEQAVGFGADLDGVPDLPAGMSGAEVYPALLEMLSKRGFSESTLAAVASGNVLRVLASLER